MKRTLLLLMTALFALALFAPAAMAQDDDANDDANDDGSAIPSASASAMQDDDADDDGSATASATASASASASGTATAAAGDDDDAPLPETGGPALLAPIAGALLLAGGVASILTLRRGRDDS